MYNETMTIIEEAHQMLDKLPESSNWQDVAYSLYVKLRIKKGLEEIEEGKSYSIEKAKERFSKKVKSRNSLWSSNGMNSQLMI